MAYTKRSVISAADFNALAGQTGAAAASPAAATAVAGYLWGIGYGDHGYGQTTPVLTPLNSNSVDVATNWANLRTIISNLASWQNTFGGIPTADNFVSNKPIIAFDGSGGNPSLATVLSDLDSNRMNYQIANMTLTSNAAQSTYGSSWGSGNSGIYTEFSVTFASEDAARAFFNSGGEIRISLSHPNTSSPRNSAWNTILNNLSVAFRATGSSRISGSYGGGGPVGYYNLTTTYQTILDGTNVGTGAYTVNDFYVQAKAQSIAGVNGGKGSIIWFKAMLKDEQTNAWSDTVASGTVASLHHLRATNGVVIAAPTCAVATAFTPY